MLKSFCRGPRRPEPPNICQSETDNKSIQVVKDFVKGLKYPVAPYRPYVGMHLHIQVFLSRLFVEVY